jgi:hypothetical protein
MDSLGWCRRASMSEHCLCARWVGYPVFRHDNFNLLRLSGTNKMWQQNAILTLGRQGQPRSHPGLLDAALTTQYRLPQCLKNTATLSSG